MRRQPRVKSAVIINPNIEPGVLKKVQANRLESVDDAGIANQGLEDCDDSDIPELNRTSLTAFYGHKKEHSVKLETHLNIDFSGKDHNHVETPPARRKDRAPFSGKDHNHVETPQNPARRKDRAPLLSYEAAMWILHILVVVLACVDRFKWNIWPRQTFQIGTGTAGSDKIDGLKDGPWSVKFYDILARVSGRFSIVALNLMLFVRLRILETWLSTSWVHRHVLDCSNIVDANLRLHIWNGIALVIMMLLHVWSIVLPCVVNGFSAQILVGTFEWPLSERKPPGFKDTNAAAMMVSLQVDDVFRLVEITIIFGILAPLSYVWFSRKWHIAIHIHRFMAAVFCIDIVRRHTHPHSIILNSPFFLLFIIDKIIFFVWNNDVLAPFHRIKLGSDYIVLFWKSERAVSRTLGPNFYLKLENDSSLTENPHAFTAFQNRRNIQFSEIPGDWTTGIILRVFRNTRKYSVSQKEAVSHTGRMADCDINTAVIRSYGPYHGEMSELITHAQNQTQPKCFCFGTLSIFRQGSCMRCLGTFSRALHGNGPVVLIGTGSGINYLLDAMQYRFIGRRELIILWSTNDSVLFHFVRKVVSEILSDKDTHLRIILSNTNKTTLINQAWGTEQNIENHIPRIVSCTTGRINFQQEIPLGAQVFFQGSRLVRKAVKHACKKNNCMAYFGHGSNNVRKIVLKDIVRKSCMYVNHKVSQISTSIEDLNITKRRSEIPVINVRLGPNRRDSLNNRSLPVTTEPDLRTTTVFAQMR